MLHGQQLIDVLRDRPRSISRWRQKAIAVLLLGKLSYGLAPDDQQPLWSELSVKELDAVTRQLPDTATTTEITDDLATTDVVVDKLVGVQIAHLSTHGLFASSRFPSAFQPRLALASDYQSVRPLIPEVLYWEKLARFGVGPLAKTDLSPDAISSNPLTFVLERCPLAASGIALSNANVEGGQAILTGELISRLNLQSMELAVISACDSNTGPSLIGEGVLGSQAWPLSRSGRSS